MLACSVVYLRLQVVGPHIDGGLRMFYGKPQLATRLLVDLSSCIAPLDGLGFWSLPLRGNIRGGVMAAPELEEDSLTC